VLQHHNSCSIMMSANVAALDNQSNWCHRQALCRALMFLRTRNLLGNVPPFRTDDPTLCITQVPPCSEHLVSQTEHPDKRLHDGIKKVEKKTLFEKDRKGLVLIQLAGTHCATCQERLV
jgi:hypothetical protein